MQSDRITPLIDSFESEINFLISKYDPMPSGVKGTITYMMDKVKKFGEKMKPFTDEVNAEANKILENFTERFEGEKKNLREKIIESGKEALLKYKRTYFN